MGNEKSKINFRKSFTQLLEKTQPVDINDNDFWNQFWNEYDTTVQDVFSLIVSDEIKTLREESPNNIATLCYKAVEKLNQLSELTKFTGRDKDIGLNCVRILTRLLPFLFEDKDWRSFFWSAVPSQPDPSGEQIENAPLAYTLMSSLTDLLFFPEFTVSSVKPGHGSYSPLFCFNKDHHEETPNNKVIDSCEYIWESGVGFSSRVHHSALFDKHRTEILKLLLTCFSETMYVESYDSTTLHDNLWIKYFTGIENRHALPLFTSLLNTIFSYDPVGYGVPYNHLVFNDTKGPLMEVSLQILCVTLESIDETLSKTHRRSDASQHIEITPGATRLTQLHSTSTDSDFGSKDGNVNTDNLFLHYMSRIHRDEDFAFILNGFIRLLNNPLIQTYLPGSTKRVQSHQELLILLWRMCDINRRFLFYLLKSSHILEVLVPILYYLNDSRSDQSKVGLVHMGVFILLMLSGERNFGVRLNKPYDNRVSMDIPVFTGTHADLLIIVFHKIITTGHHLLQPLFDCLLTVIVNISPYLKSLSMVTANKLLHLLEAFTSPWFLLSSSTNHHLVFFLLEVINNIVQYQFDGNSNLIYCIIRKRLIFFNLINFKTDQESIDSIMKQRSKSVTPKKKVTNKVNSNSESINNLAKSNELTESASTIKTTLKETPALAIMTSDYRRNISSDDVNNDSKEAIDSHKEINKANSDKHMESSSSTEANCINDNNNNKPIEISPIDNSAAPVPQSTTPDTLSETIGLTGSSSSLNQLTTNNKPPIWKPSTKWVQSWKQKLPLQTIMRLLQVLVPQVEKLCIEKGLTDESEILKFLQRGTLVGLLPVPHPILIRKYQANLGTNIWFRTYMWGVIYLRNIDPPIWYDTNVQLFEIQKISDP